LIIKIIELQNGFYCRTNARVTHLKLRGLKNICKALLEEIRLLKQQQQLSMTLFISLTQHLAPQPASP